MDPVRAQTRPVFSIRFPPAQPPERLIAAAGRAEEAGFAGIWMVDTPLVADDIFDPYVDLAVCALNTTRVWLGPAVSTFLLRHPVTVAAAVLGLHRVAGPRVRLGVGTGGSAAVTIGALAGHHGAYAGRATAHHREVLRMGIDVVRRVFAGERVDLGGRAVRTSGPRQIPVFVAASGPKALKLAGELADGVIIQLGSDPDIFREAVRTVRESASRVGRDSDAITVVASVFAAVSDDPRVDIDHIRPLASYFYSVTPWVLERAGFSVARRFPDRIPEPDLTHARNWQDAMEVAKIYIPDEVVRQLCLVGPPEAAVERVRLLAGAGADEIFLRWWSSYDLPVPLMEVFRRRVIPAFV